MANFWSIHSSHYVPIVQSDVSRVRTGFEEAVAHRTHEKCFSYSAEENGIIDSIDEKTQTLVIRYVSGKKVCLNYGSQFTNNAGAFMSQDVVINNFKVGDKFRKNDIIIYNEKFYKADPYSKQVRWKVGTLAKVALLDNGGTIEDASIITKPLADRMVYRPVYRREIVLTVDTNIHAFADVGNHVKNTDPLIVFDQSAMDMTGDDDPELAAMLGDLNKQAPKAEHTGDVVQIEVFYKSDLSEMSPSMQKLVKHVTQLKNAKAVIAAGCSNAEEFQPAKSMVATSKVGMVDLNKETVIFRFYIRHDTGMRPGDKLFYGPSLKSVISKVYDDYIYTEDGQKVECASSCRGILARLITSPFTTGIANGVLHKLEDDILDMWAGKQPVNELK